MTTLILERFDISSTAVKHALPVMVELGVSMGNINCQLPAHLIVDYDILNDLRIVSSKIYFPRPSLSESVEELRKEFRLRLEYGLDLSMFTMPFRLRESEQELWGDIEWAMFEMLPQTLE